MKWKRGFLRLWILFALIWIGVSAFGNFSSKPYFPGVYLAFDRSGKINSVSPYSGEGNSLDGFEKEALLQKIEIAGYPYATYFAKTKMSDADLRASAAKVAAFLKADHVKISDAHYRDCWVSFGLFGVIPPLAILAFGLAVAWVLSGFRPTRPA